MRRAGGGWAVRALVVALAVLVPAGVVVATTTSSSESTVVTAGGRVDAALVGLQGEPATTVTTVAAPTSTRPTVTPTSVRPATSTTRRPPATTTTRPPAPTSTLPAPVPATTLPPIPLQSAWSATDGPLSVSVRMEPAAPVAGQPVTLTITVAPGVSCCLSSTMAFGDEDAGSPQDPSSFSLGAAQRCGSDGPRRVTSTHTYAEPGAYRGRVQIVGFECLPAPDENGLSTGTMHGVQIPLCVGVGPGDAARACAR